MQSTGKNSKSCLNSLVLTDFARHYTTALDNFIVYRTLLLIGTKQNYSEVDKCTKHYIQNVTKFNTLQVHSYFTKNYNTMINSGVTVPLVSPPQTRKVQKYNKNLLLLFKKKGLPAP